MNLLVPLAQLLPPLELRRGRGRDEGRAREAAPVAAPRAEREIHEDEGGRALGHDGRGAALVGAGAPHTAVVVVARRIRVGLAVVALPAAGKKETGEGLHAVWRGRFIQNNVDCENLCQETC